MSTDTCAAKTSNDEEALDLTAVTFERAFANHRRFRRRDGGVHAWLLRIARNAAIDASRRRRPTVDLAGADAHLGRAGRRGRPPRPSEHRSARSRRAASRRPARRPPPPVRGGLTAREIGIVIGKRESAAQKHIERGLATLRGGDSMTDHDDIEVRLRQALRVSLPAGRRQVARRGSLGDEAPIAAPAVAVGGPVASEASRLGAALALMAGTVAATLTLLERIASESTPASRRRRTTPRSWPSRRRTPA